MVRCSLCWMRLSIATPVTQAMPGYDNTRMPPMANRIFVVLFIPRLPGVTACGEDTRVRAGPPSSVCDLTADSRDPGRQIPQAARVRIASRLGRGIGERAPLVVAAALAGDLG